MIKNIFRYILVIATVAAFASCSVDEIDNVGSKGVVKFVVQPTNYIGCNVSAGSTKASAEDFENKIVNAHFLLFNADGNLMHSESFEDVTNNTIPPQVVDMDLLEKADTPRRTVTACFIANVPTSTVSGFTTLSQVKEAVLDIHYYSGKVLDSDNNQNFFVIPEFDLKDDGEMIQCIPMLGVTECTLGSSTSFDVSLKRLFAKVSMNISVGNLSLDNITSRTFDILAAHLLNIPTKVKLTEPTGESAWVKDATAFLQTQIEGPIDGDEITSIGSSSYDFYFYVPEYYLSPTNDGSGNYGNQKYKPNMYDDSKFPILVRLFGEYGEGGSNKQGVTYDLYLGEDASTSFTLKRNMHYKNLIKINGITNSINGTGVTLDCRVEVAQLDEVEILGQTANCYIIGQVGTYLYPAYKGVWKKDWGEVPESYKCTKGTTLKVIYQDNSSIKLENMAFNKETCEISFDVTSVDGGTGLLSSNDGNVVIGLYDDNGVIEWSWHLWVLSGSTFNDYLGGYEISTQSYPSGSNRMMDRNLGAKITALQQSRPGMALGLYYKYGHKEPFIDNYYRGGGESANYSWVPTNSAHNKSQTDPCPPGYRMPMSSIWNDGATVSATKEHASILLVGDAFRFYNNSTTDDEDDVYYPYSGYVDSNSNNKVQSQGYGRPDTAYNFSATIPSNYTNLGTTTASNYSDNYIATNGGAGPAMFTNVIYSTYDINNLGTAFAKDKELRYGFTEKGTEIISCTVRIGKWKRTGSLFSGGYKFTAEWGDAQNLTGAQLKSQYENAYNRLISVINGKDGSNSNIILSAFFKDPETSFVLQDINTSNGYQVRCLKDL